jgi:hypothetical protein
MKVQILSLLPYDVVVNCSSYPLSLSLWGIVGHERIKKRQLWHYQTNASFTTMA